MKRLIVNADDFGCSPGVSKGILTAHHDGIVTSTSVMVNMPIAAAAIERSPSEAPRLGLGLHLTLTSGPAVHPKAGIPDLVDSSGMLLPKQQIIPRLEQIDPAQIERECRAQIERFIQIAGRPPDHLNSHHYAVYLSYASTDILIRLAVELRVPIRRPLSRELTSAENVASRPGLGDNVAAAADRQVYLARLHAEGAVHSPDELILTSFAKRRRLAICSTY